MSSEITLNINDKKFTGWTEISVQRSIETLTGNFSFSVTDRQNQINNSVWPIKTQDKAIVKIGGASLINGFVFKVSANVGPQSHRIRISGRDKTADLVDTSADSQNKKFTLNKTNLKKLAETLAKPYGIGVEVSPGTSLMKTFNISFNTSESPFEILDRKAKEFGVLIITNSSGKLVLTNAGTEKLEESLVLGKNIIEGSIDYDYSNRFSKYTVFAQTSGSGGWGKNINVKREATDPNINRFRPIILQSENAGDNDRAQLRANYEANVRAARSQNIKVTVQGFLMENGKPWELNKLVQIFAPALYINPGTTLLITSVEYIVNEGGSFTHLTLKRKDAFERLPGKKVKSQNSLGW